MVVKKLYRNTKNKYIAGVCSGLGEYLEIDPTVIRLIWAISIIFWGIGIIIYIILWIIIPTKKTVVSKKKKSSKKK